MAITYFKNAVLYYSKVIAVWQLLEESSWYAHSVSDSRDFGDKGNMSE